MSNSDIIIDLDESHEEVIGTNVTNVTYVTDCFGRIRTVEEIKKRDKFRKEVFCIALMILWFIAAVSFIITMFAYLPVDGKPITEIFIISSIINCIIVGIPLLTVIGGFILNCCSDLI